MYDFDLIRKRRAEIQSNILKGFNSELGEVIEENSMFAKGEVEFDDELEKAVYADTPQNRKLGRVGQEYKRGGSKTDENNNSTQKFSKEEHAKNVKKIFSGMSKFGKGLNKTKAAIDEYCTKHNLSHHDFNEIMHSDKKLSDWNFRRDKNNKTVIGEKAEKIAEAHAKANKEGKAQHSFKDN